ncbi:uncharacterized protein FA14DRAFT_159432 [Meira miltonrushii]|uniref:Uncharacterized protein n=1 Tax=Meira miltonrushii TaxID=1280837 RepID=A0A316VJD3_9BASI|nr:uncharacterized protein FA14DRAFT_159432 [Meira miltonrushii]PWN37334.1 hypothetical protein FA14DRAFT_159432 [Meira miltonrushii]
MAHLTRYGSRLGQSFQYALASTSSTSASCSRRSFHQSASLQSAEPAPTSMTSSEQQAETSVEAGHQYGAMGEGASEPSAGPRTSGRRDNLPPYPVWRNSIGKQYERPPPGSKGPFWIGETPFPLNPSFNPPAPVAHATKEDMWKLHTSNPSTYNVRKLSGQFGIPIERVLAILRLMALEKEFKQQGKALQTPFQKEMEKLLGSQSSRSAGVQKELDALSTIPAGTMGGAIFEEIGLGESDANKPSELVPALRQESKERRERIRKMPTGGPASKGPVLESVHIKGQKDKSSTRSPITFVDMSSRPTSYSGAGRLARNQKRAEQRKANRDKRRALDEKWTLRTELAKRIEAGERTPEIFAQKAKLDAEKIAEDEAREAVLRKRYKSNRKRKMAFKIKNGQAPRSKRK